jgi:hypothetical protein
MKTIQLSDSDYNLFISKLPLVLQHTNSKTSGSDKEVKNATGRLIILTNKIIKRHILKNSSK